jgi:hypothetical protein
LHRGIKISIMEDDERRKNVTRVKGSALEMTTATLPKSAAPHVYVLEQSK